MSEPLSDSTLAEAAAWARAAKRTTDQPCSGLVLEHVADVLLSLVSEVKRLRDTLAAIEAKDWASCGHLRGSDRCNRCGP